MSYSPLVSVAIPAYKVTYLETAIKSVLAQTIKDWELIIVNDCSPYGVHDVVAPYLSDFRIRYCENEHNIGGENPANNWNRCLELAKAPYFALLCDDDQYEPQFLEVMLSLADKYPNCNTFRARANIVNAQGNEINRYASSPEWETWDDYLWHVVRNLRMQTISEWMFRTNALRQVGGYALLPLAWYADYLSILRVAQHGGIASSSQVLMHFRSSGENISSRDSENTALKIKAQLIYRDEVVEMVKGLANGENLLGALDQQLHGHLVYNLEHAHPQVLWNLYLHRKEYGLNKRKLWRALRHRKH